MPGKDHKPWTRQSNSRLKALPSEGAVVSVQNFGLELLFVELHPEFGSTFTYDPRLRRHCLQGHRQAQGNGGSPGK